MRKNSRGRNPKLKQARRERFEVLLEDMNEKFDFVAENTVEILKLKPVMEKMANDLEVVKTDVELMIGYAQARG